MAKERKLPLRKCSGCGEMKAKTELVRVVRSPEGELSMDLTGRKAGRGAYVCRNIDCAPPASARRWSDPSPVPSPPRSTIDWKRR